MKRICKRLLLLLATLGAGALAYALMRSEGERVLRRAEEGPAAPAEPGRCIAVTASGKRCGRPALSGSQYCWQHGG